MHKEVVAAVCGRDEAKPLGCIEPLDGALLARPVGRWRRRLRLRLRLIPHCWRSAAPGALASRARAYGASGTRLASGTGAAGGGVQAAEGCLDQPSGEVRSLTPTADVTVPVRDAHTDN